HTWRLVTISGRLDDVRKLGDRWRAEAVLGSQRVVVVGQPGARIPIDTLEEGRTAELTGIVRPPYPSATDRRPTLLPRSAADVRVDSAGASAAGSGTRKPAAPASQAAANPVGPLVPDVDLADLASVVGADVRVGGLVVDLRPTGFTLDDGTAIGSVVLAGSAADWIGLIEPGDAINVRGRVDRIDGDLAVLVEDPAAIVLGSALGHPASSIVPGSSPASSVVAVDGGILTAGFGDPGGGLPGAGVSLMGLIAISLASVAVTLLRRRHARRLLAVRVAARLSAFAGSDGRPAGVDPPLDGPPPRREVP
ncbi:MAG: hypothetical protein ACXW4T_07600, partial [Candidatus Limnocylindrales bacterium]